MTTKASPRRLAVWIVFDRRRGAYYRLPRVILPKYDKAWPPPPRWSLPAGEYDRLRSDPRVKVITLAFQ